MNSFFFGSSERPLFGVHHPPKGKETRSEGVVLCYPMGQEYMRSHRAFRQLANLLVRRGHHVFRFDYYGTGDSAGASDEGSLSQWVSDVGSAIEEFKDNASLQRVSLVGLRLGAALATLAAADRDDVEKLVLWDPVVRGSSYLAELLAAAKLPAGANGAPKGTIGVLGFPLTQALRDELAQLDLTRIEDPGARALEIVVSSERPEWSELHAEWTRRGMPAHYECIASGGNWNEVDNFGSALLPQELIQGIVARFEKESA
jgi:pimeloyl-ACP methyl ester carboxylesterase